MTPLQAHLALALAWFTFGLGHSLFASEPVKARLAPLLGPWYRLAYNGFALLHLAGVWAVGWWLFAPNEAFPYPDWARWSLKGVYILGWGGFLYGLTGYDLGRLMGTAQLRNHFKGITEPEDEPLRTDGLHRYVRHPLYAGGFLIIWGRVGSEFDLAVAVWASLYLVVGTVFEERKLLRLYGDAYADYRAKVPAVLPWRGRVL